MQSQESHPLFQDIKKILVVKLKNIGDVLLTTPCIRALHETFPAATISMLVNEGTDTLLQNHPLLEEVIAFPRSSMKGFSLSHIQKEISFVGKVRDRGFDMVVDLTSGDRPAWISWLSGARYRLAYDPAGRGFFGKSLLYTHLAPYPHNTGLHEVKKNLGVLECFQIQASAPRLEMHLSENDLSGMTQILESKSPGLLRSPFVVVHPTSRWLFKCWVDERFARLIDWLQQECHFPVVLTCGPDPDEIRRAQKVIDLCSVKPVLLLGVLSLPQWAALVKKSRLFIGVDSAPMHIAASQSTPTLALFGPTGFQNWRPWEVENAVLVHDCPCSKDRQPHCDWDRSKIRRCMEEITLEEAQKAVSGLLGKLF